jgi:hypothetical protein
MSDGRPQTSPSGWMVGLFRPIEPAETLAITPPVEPPPVEPMKDNRKGVTIRLSPDAWRQLKFLAVEEGRPAHELLIEGVNTVFAKRGKPTIA